ncbi:MAG: hypothetical protein Q8784_01830 [Vigna little leaf phytoplasma]|nr:hypothetical protein [Vigna little leaf phytoplasma]
MQFFKKLLNIVLLKFQILPTAKNPPRKEKFFQPTPIGEKEIMNEELIAYVS